ncbi:MAG: putative toxin-antitoxin system toxin component, PIN family [Acidimicrobiales bacterium]
MRAVLDVNVIVSATLSRGGTPALLLRAWLEGAYELVVSPALLEELHGVLDYPRIASCVTSSEAAELVNLLRRQAESIEDPRDGPTIRSSDPDDDYLISLAEAARAVIVSGDRHLLGLAEQIPVYTPAQFLALLPGQVTAP